MAYPCGGKNCDKRVANVIRNNTIIKYARTITTTKSFEPFNDLYQYQGTLYHHDEWNLLFDKGMEFLELQTDTPKVFYIWGHSYEFDMMDFIKWERFEEFCKLISGKKDIIYATNQEVLKLVGLL